MADLATASLMEGVDSDSGWKEPEESQAWAEDQIARVERAPKAPPVDDEYEDQADEPDNEGDEGEAEPEAVEPDRFDRREKTPEQKRLADARRKSRTLERELALRDARLAEIEQRLAEQESNRVVERATALKSEVEQLDDAIERARMLKGEALRSGDADAVIQHEKIQERLVDMRAEKRAAFNQLQQQFQQRPQQQRREAPRSLPPLAKAWADDNAGIMRDPASFKVVESISTALEREGYSIHDPDHYRELTARARAALPKHFQPRRTPPTSGQQASSSPRVGDRRQNASQSAPPDVLRFYMGTNAALDLVDAKVASGMKPAEAKKAVADSFSRTFLKSQQQARR